MNLLLRLLVTGAFLAFALTRVDLAQAGTALHGLAGWGPAAAALLLLVNLGLQWARWHLLAAAGGLGISAGRSLRIVLAGFPLGLLTPGRMGELGRGAVVAGTHDSVSVAGLTALERSFGLMAGLGLASLGMIASSYGTFWKWALILLVYAGALGAVLHPPLLARLARRIGGWLPDRAASRVQGFGGRFVQGWHLAGRRIAMAVFGLSILQVGVVLLQLTLCYTAAGAGQSLLKVAGAWAVVMGAKYLLPITVGDLGVREGLAVAVFTDRAMPPAPALVAALLIYLLNVLIPSAVGALLLARGRGRS